MKLLFFSLSHIIHDYKGRTVKLLLTSLSCFDQLSYIWTFFSVSSHNFCQSQLFPVNLLSDSSVGHFLVDELCEPLWASLERVCGYFLEDIINQDKLSNAIILALLANLELSLVKLKEFYTWLDCPNTTVLLELWSPYSWCSLYPDGDCFGLEGEDGLWKGSVGNFLISIWIVLLHH